MSLPSNVNHPSLCLRNTALHLAALALCTLSFVTARDSQAQNTINTFAGGGAFIPSGGSPTSLDLPGPTGTIRDAAGNTYIAAPYSTYVLNVSGGVTTVFAGIGIAGYGGDGGLATSATLGLPTALAFDSQGNIYIADPRDSRIRMVSMVGPTKGIISTIAGCNLQCTKPAGKCVHPVDNCGDGGPAYGPNALLNLPLGIAVDGNDVLYIADAYDNRIRAVNLSGATVTVFGVQIKSGNIATVAGSVGGNSNQCPNPIKPCGDGGLATAAELNYPQSVAFDSAGNMYIADTRDDRVRWVNASTAIINAKVGKGKTCLTPTGACGDGGPYGNANLTMPMAVLLDSSNNIYIADTLDHKVRFANTQTSGSVKVFGVTVPHGDIATVAGDGNAGFSGDNGPATSAWLNFPNGVFLDSTGNLLVSDTGNQRVRQIVSAGTISTFAGGGLGGDGGPPSSAVLANPYNVAEDSSGNVYIVDTANERIRAVNTQSGPITVYGVTIPAGDIATVAGTGVSGATGDGGPGTSATLNGPMSIALDSSNNLFIADTANFVIRRLDRSSGTITLYAGTYGKMCPGGTPPTCGDGGLATSATFNTPQAVGVDTAGNVYVADYNALTVREVNASTGIIETFAGNGKGSQACPTTPVPATSTGIFHPSSVSIDSAGNVYIDNTYGNSICRVSGGMLSQYALNGKSGYSGDGGPALNASQFFPLQSTLDPAGNLLLGGGDFNCIRRVDAVTYTIGTVAGDVGQNCLGGFSGDGGPATSAKISSAGFSIDANSNLYIADEGNNRVRLVHLTPAITTVPPPNFGAWPIGMTSTPQTLTITSSGGVDLSVTGLGPIGGTNAGDFQVTSQTCTAPSSLGVDESCTVTFTLTPKNYGLRTATYPISDNGPGSPQSITLSGYGPYFTVSASPTTLTINPGSSGNSTLTIAPFGSFTGQVNLSTTGCTAPTFSPPCQINPSFVILDGVHSATATLTVNVSSSAAPGTYNITAKGSFGASGQLQSWANLRIVVP